MFSSSDVQIACLFKIYYKHTIYIFMSQFIHTFWSKPLTSKMFFDIRKALEITLYEYALSVELVHKFGNRIVLYTDYLGSKILGVIPYDDIIVIDNTITNNYHFAASFKFEALKKMDIKDVLIDGDIFLHRKKVYEIIENNTLDVLTSFFEPKSYIDTTREKHEKLFNILKNTKQTFTPEDYDDIEGWYNTSLMRFNNEELKTAYIDQYINNVNLIDENEYGNVWPDLILEQRNLYRTCKSLDKSINVVVEHFPTEQSNDYAREIGFLHVGSAKEVHHPVVINDLTNLNKPLVDKINNRLAILYQFFNIEYGNK